MRVAGESAERGGEVTSLGHRIAQAEFGESYPSHLMLFWSRVCAGAVCVSFILYGHFL
jgi:hypothetical protein